LPKKTIINHENFVDFPRTVDQRVYHLGLRPGEVANRLITVGTPSRAECVFKFLDLQPKPFVLSSERGFLTITGRYKGVPVSIVSIGMGDPNMDFFVREVRECLSGDMCIIRLGSCGALVDIPVGSIVVPKACVAITRNVDFDFLDPIECHEPAYRISKQVQADAILHSEVQNALQKTKPEDMKAEILAGTVNASADSFYSSQGRQTSFPDHNSDLLPDLQRSVPDVATLEMETFHLFHLAACWKGRRTSTTITRADAAPPLTTDPVRPIVSAPSSPVSATRATTVDAPDNTVIRAAAAQMVFASRVSQDFITPQHVSQLEQWSGLAMLEALCTVDIPEERLHPEKTSVWEIVV